MERLQGWTSLMPCTIILSLNQLLYTLDKKGRRPWVFGNRLFTPSKPSIVEYYHFIPATGRFHLKVQYINIITYYTHTLYIILDMGVSRTNSRLVFTLWLRAMLLCVHFIRRRCTVTFPLSTCLYTNNNLLFTFRIILTK